MSDDMLIGPIRIRIIRKKRRLFRKSIKEYIHLELEVTAKDTIKIRKVKGDIEEVHADIKRGFDVSGEGISITNLNLDEVTITGSYSAYSGPLDMWFRSLESTTKRDENGL